MKKISKVIMTFAIALTCVVAMKTTAKAWDTEITPSTTETNAPTIELNKDYIATVHDDETIRYLKFRTSSDNGYYTIKTDNYSISRSQYTSILTTGAQVIVEASDYSGSAASFSQVKLSPNTTYYYRIHESENAGNLGLSVYFTPDYVGYAMNSAAAYTVGKDTKSTLDGYDEYTRTYDEDWFIFVCPENDVYRLSGFTYTEYSSIDFGIYTPYGQEVGKCRSYESNSGKVDVTLEKGQRYYIKVDDGKKLEVYNYGFKLEAYHKVTDISLSKQVYQIQQGQTLQLKPIFGPSNATIRTVEWSGGNSYTASLSTTGLVKGIAPGNITVHCCSTESSGIYANAKVVVTTKKPGLRKVKNAGKKKLKLSWARQAGADGYQIFRATKKNGKYKYIKTINTEYNYDASITYVDKKAKGKKTYYYKVRSYEKLDNKKYYSPFSKIKSKKAK